MKRGTLRIYGGLLMVGIAFVSVFTVQLSSTTFGLLMVVAIAALFCSASGFDARDQKPLRRSLGKFLPPKHCPKDLTQVPQVRSTVVFIAMSDEYGVFAVENLGEAQ